MSKKNKEIVDKIYDFSGRGRWIRTTEVTESESVALPLGDTPKFKCLYILSNQLKIYKRFWGVCGKKIKFLSVYLF